MRYVLKFLRFIPEKVMEEVNKKVAEGEMGLTDNVAASFYLELEDSAAEEKIKERAAKMCQETGYDAVKIFRELE